MVIPITAMLIFIIRQSFHTCASLKMYICLHFYTWNIWKHKYKKYKSSYEEDLKCKRGISFGCLSLKGMHIDKVYYYNNGQSDHYYGQIFGILVYIGARKERDIEIQNDKRTQCFVSMFHSIKQLLSPAKLSYHLNVVTMAYSKQNI